MNLILQSKLQILQTREINATRINEYYYYLDTTRSEIPIVTQFNYACVREWLIALTVLNIVIVVARQKSRLPLCRPIVHSKKQSDSTELYRTLCSKQTDKKPLTTFVFVIHSTIQIRWIYSLRVGNCHLNRKKLFC